MKTSDERSTIRFGLVTAGHRFLMRALPFRDPDTELALRAMVDDASTCGLPEPERDAILLRCLRVLDRHTGARVPTLVERYLAGGSDPRQSVERFAACVRDALRYRGVGDPRIQQAIAIVDKRFGDPTLNQKDVALAVDTSPATFSVQFRRSVGETFSAFLRNRRLDHAASLLATTTRTIKEVWAAVGYNHAANFDHDFKRRFGETPREYRVRTIHAASELPCDHLDLPSAQPSAGPTSGPPKTLLVVDDDEVMRRTLGTLLRLNGYAVSFAAGGAEGLQQAVDTSPDGILLDYRMDDMDGLTFLRQLRQRKADPIRVALFTADWDIYDREPEVWSLDAIIASKLCDLDEIERLVAYLVS